MSFTMYEKFDLYLMEGYTKEFISLENESQTIGEKYWFDEYWYEYGCDKAIEILSKFTQDDWNKLTKEIFITLNSPLRLLINFTCMYKNSPNKILDLCIF